jgi:hypothetical protein
MKSIGTKVTALLLGCFALTGAAAAANVQDIVHETQRMSTEEGQISIVWWIPTQFWEESLKGSPMMTDAARQQVLAALADYTVVVLMRGRQGISGISDIQPKAELLKNAQVTINGKPVEPLPPEQVAPATTVLLAQMKPAIAATAGQVGQGMEFVVYPGKVDGQPPLDATQPGSIAVTFYGKTYQWHLPLGSLLPPKIDRSTGDEFPGNYQFNPYTGRKLADK